VSAPLRSATGARRTRRAATLALALALAQPWPGAQARPYTPASGAEVVEVLPARADPAQRELQRLRAELSAAPGDLALASGLARRYLAIARASGDPRYLGYAQAALAPWWRQPAPPAAARLLRATLLQSGHQFDAALADLDGVLRAEPGNPQAWLTRATVQTVRGDYAGATASCARLSALSTELVALACLANATSLNGRLAASEQLLERTWRRAAGAKIDAETGLWVLTLLAEMATRRGDAGAAEAGYRRALALAPGDAYLLGAYADFLLDQRRPAEALRLVGAHTRVDALLLRQALALRQMPDSAAALAAATRELRARFEAAALRGDSVHLREQARFTLHLADDPGAALALARRNWAVQKEPADLRIYLEAALDARVPGAAAPALDWLRRSALEDVAVAALAQRLRSRP
jgi:tetratricopeptide (TPR) repeat protein